MRSEHEVTLAIEGLVKRQQAISDAFEQSIMVQAALQKSGDHLTLRDAAETLHLQMTEVADCERMINVLKWVTGERVNLPWR